MSASRPRSGRRRSGTRGRGGRLPDWLIAALIGLASLAIFGGLIGTYWWVSANKVKVDAANCPVKGPPVIHALLIDRSDAITPLQQQQVMQRVARLVEDAVAGERFDLYVAEGDGANTLSPSVSLCSPGKGSDASALYQNPAMIERAFNERFIAPLRQELAKLMESTQRPTSPILESIRTVAIMSFGKPTAETKELRLTVISDMVQHSPAISQFRSDASFGDLERRPQWRGLQANLTGVDISVIYLLRASARRPSGQPIQTRGHQLFWEQALRASGARTISMDSF